MKKQPPLMLCATALGVSLLLAACGGGGGDDGPNNGNGNGQTTNPGAGNQNGNGGSNNGGTNNNGGSNDGGANNGGGTDTPPAPPFVSVLQASPDDLPTAINQDYPDASTPMVLNVDYVQTALPGGPQFISSSDGSCVTAVDPLSYPNNFVTLFTLNLTERVTEDDCLPEINVNVTSTHANFADPATGAKTTTGKMRVRGSSTRYASQKSFRVKLDSKMWFGEDTLQLNKHPYDLTRVRNKLSFDLMKLIPHHQTLRTQFVEIQYSDNINTGSAAGPVGSMGLFTHIEKMGKGYVERRNWDVAGANLYKVEKFNFNEYSDFKLEADGKPGANFEKYLEVELDSGANHDRIIQAVAELNDMDVPFSQTFDKYFNKNNYITWLASVILLGNYDTRNQNYAMYQSPKTNKFYFLPWDYDAALDYSRQPNADVYEDFAYGVGNWWDSVLHRRFLSEPGNIELLEKVVDEIYTRHLTKDNVRKLIDSYKPTVNKFVTTSPDGMGELPYDGSLPQSEIEQWNTEYERLATVLDKNYQQFKDSLKAPMPFWMSFENAPAGVEVRWSWPESWHPQGHAIEYKLDIVQRGASSAVPAGKSPFEVPGANVQTVYQGPNKNSVISNTTYAGEYWIRVLATDPINNTSTYGFDMTWDDNAKNSHGDLGMNYFGMVCRNLITNTPCAGLE